MPKRKKNPKGAGGLDVLGARSGGSDDNASVRINDDDSIVSVASSDAAHLDELGLDESVRGVEASEGDGGRGIEFYEEKLSECIDLATQKSSTGRVNALDSITKALRQKYVPELIDNRYITLADLVERSLKKGKSSEQVAAANLATLITVQLIDSSQLESAYRALKPSMVTLLLDDSANVKARAAAAIALATCSLLCVEIGEIENVMETLEKVFEAKVKGNIESDFMTLKAAALSAWTVLATLLSASQAMHLLRTRLKIISSLLESSDVDLRITSGETLVVLYELSLGKEEYEEEAYGMMESLLSQLRQLATDSHKYRSKKDRKEQKSQFRDIVKTIEDGEEYYEKVAFNTHEMLHIESWAMKKQYDHLCKTLTSGMNLHLSENELLREVFQLGEPIPQEQALTAYKPSKLERQLANQQAFKWRSINRGKHRDKRSAVV